MSFSGSYLNLPKLIFCEITVLFSIFLMKWALSWQATLRGRVCRHSTTSPPSLTTKTGYMDPSNEPSRRTRFDPLDFTLWG
mmetsp:Transcript_46313/g.107778  ORF Transcript_46313/g.107778 Transcript_46313/m.107778 type:complete len:81 (+) Transcript_46313:1150-1392(+)